MDRRKCLSDSGLYLFLGRMKTLPLCAFALVFQFVGLSAATVEVDSRIDSVTVYQGMAKVTRVFEVNLPAGEAEELRFLRLPRDVDPALVQVGVTDGAALDFGVSSFSNSYADADRSETLKALAARVRELTARKAALEADRDALKAEVGNRHALVAALQKGLAETGKVELYELSKTAYAEAAQAEKEAFARIAALNEPLLVAAQELSAADKERQKQLDRELATAGKYTVAAASVGGVSRGTISYYVARVSWRPSYVARADTSAGNVAISYLCMVSQNSGEDWRDVALSLETAFPTVDASPREPESVFLRHESPVAMRAMKAVPSVGGVAANAVLDDSFVARESLAGARVDSVATLVGFSASLSGRVTVASSGDRTTLTLASKVVPCEFHTEAVPATGDSAFLVGKLKNGFDLPMLDGEMQVIVDGSTNGSGRVGEALPGVEMTLGFGVNQNVLVERKTLSVMGAQGGFFGGRRVESRSYLNRLTNHMRSPARILVRDAVPISRDDKISVDIKQPKDARIDPENGRFETELTLQPGASIELPVEYSVSYPSDWQITSF